jgi:2-methylisocitrate lyase-like PEP mutase family enzyme
MTSPAAKLRTLLAEPGLRVMPCCFDALSARLVERAGFPLTFLSGFAVSAAKLALPDAGLLSYGELVDHGRDVTAAVSIPVIADADTGFGNAVNVKRTLRGLAAAGFACVMIEDQRAPKRCGHVRGKQVVERGEALARIRAAVDARDEGAGILILARTDAAAVHGLDEAIARARAFRAAGADILFVEAPRSEAELVRVARALEGAVLMANLVEGGDTPLLPPAALQALGYRIAAYPLTLLSVAVRAVGTALETMRAGAHPSEDERVSFEALRELVGFPAYDAAAERYASDE